jgi:hypothetical protein
MEAMLVVHNFPCLEGGTRESKLVLGADPPAGEEAPLGAEPASSRAPEGCFRVLASSDNFEFAGWRGGGGPIAAHGAPAGFAGCLFIFLH